MSEGKNKFQSIREWVVEHKLRTVGNDFFVFLLDLDVYVCRIWLWIRSSWMIFMFWRIQIDSFLFLFFYWFKVVYG